MTTEREIRDAAVEAARWAMMQTLGDQFGTPLGQIEVHRLRKAVRAGMLAFELAMLGAEELAASPDVPMDAP